MAYKKYKKGDKVINATEKAYKVIYKQQGFIPLEDDENKDNEENKSNNDENVEDEVVEALNELTVDELKEMAKEENITGYSKMKKAELVEVLK